MWSLSLSRKKKKIFFPLEDKLHIFASPCNILYIMYTGSSVNQFLNCSIFSTFTHLLKRSWFSLFFRAVIVIAFLFILSATGIFLKAIRMLVVEKQPLKVLIYYFLNGGWVCRTVSDLNIRFKPGISATLHETASKFWWVDLYQSTLAR